MKKWLVILIGSIVFSPVFAYDFAKLRVKISVPVKDNRYFLCVTNAGCVSIQAGNKGKVYPMDAGQVLNIITTDVSKRIMHPQSVPASCQREIKAGQTLTILGKLASGKNKVVISNIRCVVS